MARPKLKPNIDPTQLVTNPFSLSDNFTIKARAIDTSNEIISKQDLESGVSITQKARVTSSFVAERESFTKLFINSSRRIHMMQLPPRALSLFLFIAYELTTGVDWLWINKGRYMDESEMSLNTYKEAIKDLVRENVITPTVFLDTYWINPLLFFAGNRLKKYPDAVVEEY